MLLQFLLRAVAKKKSRPLFDITLTYLSVKPAIFHGSLMNGEGWRQKFISRPERERADGFFSENCRECENNNPGEFPTKQAKFCVKKKYNESLGRISIVINARVYSPGMSVGMSKGYSFDAKHDIGDTLITMFKMHRDKKL